MSEKARGWSKANQRQSSRRKPRYDAYRNGQRREINKAIRVLKHVERQPEDSRAHGWLRDVSALALTKARKELARRRAEQ